MFLARLIRVSRLPLFLLIAILVLFASPVRAQQVFQLGTPPGSPTMNIPMGVVNLKNGNVHLEFPLKTLVQRNALKVTSKLIYDSMNCLQSPYAYATWWCGSGWRLIYSPFQYGSSPYLPYIQTSQNTTQCTIGNGSLYYTPVVWSNFTFTDGTGTSHPFINITVNNSDVTCTGTPDPPTTGYATDGSGYRMSVTLPSQNATPVTQVWDIHGNLMGTGEDTNGNLLSTTDELGRSYMPGSLPSGGAGSQQWAGSTIQWENIPAYTAFGGTEFNGTISVVSSITLPDGRSYQFTYDQGTTQGHYGQITGVTLPTGGQVSLDLPPRSAHGIIRHHKLLT